MEMLIPAALSSESTELVPSVDLAEPRVAWVWRVPLRCAATVEMSLLDLLDADETARAARFATSKLRRRHVVSHGVLRLILSAFSGRNPRSINIASGSRGKPYVLDAGPHFSLSHSADLALVAISGSGPVGVDVEQVRPDLRIDTLARGLLPSDATRIEGIPPDMRTRAWFQAWTQVEAVAKASGEGLRERAAVGSCELSPFRTWNLNIDEKHVGAVAAPPPVTTVVYEALVNVASAYSRFGFS